MYVHRQCLDRFLIREAAQERCVLMKTHETNPASNHVIYCTCTVCKCRFEYSSQPLIDTLAKVNHLIRSNLLQSSFQQRIQSQLGQSTSNENSTQEGSEAFVSDSSIQINTESFLRIIQELPADIQARVFNFVNILLDALQEMTPEEVYEEFTKTIQYVRYAMMTGSACAVILMGVSLRYLF